jgi:hypothetical protein
LLCNISAAYKVKISEAAFTNSLKLSFKGIGDYTYHSAGSSFKVTDRILVRAAAVMVVTAGCRLQRAAPPSKAIVTVLIYAAACASSRA